MGDDLARSWIPEAARLDYFPLVEQDAELAESALHRFNLNARFPSQLRCHTGSQRAFDGSHRAVTNRNIFHGRLSETHNLRARRGELWRPRGAQQPLSLDGAAQGRGLHRHMIAPDDGEDFLSFQRRFREQRVHIQVAVFA